MKRNEIDAFLTSRQGCIKTENDTRNGWGFAGSVFTQYKFDGWFVNIGTAHFRHASKQPFITLTVSGDRIIDREQGSRAFNVVKEYVEKFL